MECILHALAGGDAEGVYAGADWLVQIAEFLRGNRTREGVIITDVLSGERVRLLSVLQQRHASLDLWRRKADRLLNLVMRMQNAQPFWPGPGATRGAETWRIIDDCMSVMLTFALNLPRLVEGKEKDPEDIFDIARSRDEVGRLARDATNILHGGRRDTARGHALSQVLGMITIALQVLADPDDTATLRITHNLADSYGEAFRETDVLRATYASIQHHRAKGQLPAIAADLVWSAFQIASRDGPPRPDVFRFPMGADAEKRGRRALMQDFAKARRRTK